MQLGILYSASILLLSPLLTIVTSYECIPSSGNVLITLKKIIYAYIPVGANKLCRGNNRSFGCKLIGTTKHAKYLRGAVFSHPPIRSVRAGGHRYACRVGNTGTECLGRVTSFCTCLIVRQFPTMTACVLRRVRRLRRNMHNPQLLVC